MALKAVVENLDDVPEALRVEYKKTKIKDAKGIEADVFALDLTEIDWHPEIISLRNAHERQKQRNNEVQAQLTELKKKLEGLPEDFEPEMVQRLQDEIAELKEKGVGDPKAVADARKQLESTVASLQKQLADSKKREEDLTTSYEGEIAVVLGGTDLTKALVEVGVEPKHMKMVSAFLERQVKVVKEDGKRKAIVETNLGPVDVAKFVKDWAGSDEGKEYVAKAKGGGAGGSDGRGSEVNPWVEDKAKGIRQNLTQQGEIMKSDKPKAKRMMQAAGMSEDQIQRRLGSQAA